MFNKRFVEQPTLLFQKRCKHLDAGSTKMGDASTTDLGVGIDHADKDTANLGGNKSIGTRGGFTEMGAGFEGYIDIGPLRQLGRLSQCMDLGMGGTCFPVPSLADNDTIPDNHATNSRIGSGFTNSFSCQSYGTPHHLLVKASHFFNNSCNSDMNSVMSLNER